MSDAAESSLNFLVSAMTANFENDSSLFDGSDVVMNGTFTASASLTRTLLGPRLVKRIHSILAKHATKVQRFIRISLHHVKVLVTQIPALFGDDSELLMDE